VVLDSFDLSGRIALVTGAGRGIGEACGLGLAEAGADLVLVSRSREELEQVAERAAALGRRAQVAPCDVTSAEDVGAVAAEAGRVDILVNSAGTNIPEPFLEVSEQTFDTLIAVNLKGTFLMSQAIGRSMSERGEGAIVNISSQMGHVGGPNRTAYCASKHGVEGLTKAMALELASRGVRVNAVAPTYVETPMTRRFLADPQFRADTVSRIPLGRVGSVEDVVGAVLYLASPAAALVTGASLLVDGGYTAQ
jgi:NAD(P)-dependent dehydrogenase (short-subunit alcohol dehydrogenase family)